METTPLLSETEESGIAKTAAKIYVISLALSQTIYIAMIAIGSWGIHKCPINENIPNFLIATGVIGLHSRTTHLIHLVTSKKYPLQYLVKLSSIVEAIFIGVGAYWVFKAYKPDFNEADGNSYCNKTVYMFAFVYLTCIYAILIVVFSCCVCWLCCLRCLVSNENMDEDLISQLRSRLHSEDNR